MIIVQICIDCDHPTGHTEDDLLEVGDHGPICEECYREYKCRSCCGTGQYRVLRDPITKRLDYIRGEFFGEMATCDRCDGEGYRCD